MMLAVNTIDPAPSNTAKNTDLDATAWLRAVASQRDRESFERLYRLYAPKLKSYMARQGADGATADDLAQEAMVQVWRKADQYDPSKASPAAWIYRIARNLRIDKLRRQKLHEVEFTAEADRMDEGRNGHQAITDQIDGQQLRNHVNDLPDDQMEVVRLAFFEGLSHSEVGQRLSIPLGTVKSRLRLAFAKLRLAMGEQT